jgi:predicted metal-binding membrane protein
MWSAQSDGRIFAGVVAGMAAVAWLALFVWGLSPYGALLGHEALGDFGLAITGSYAVMAGIYAVGWALMIVAMMLPTSLPLLLLFRTLTRSRSNKDLLAVLVVAGYVLAWLGFGLFAHLGDLGIHRVLEGDPSLQRYTWLLAAAPLLLAGAYQFTPLKYVCLDKCRSPYMFIMERWRGDNDALQSLRIGISHGLFCVGCCWPVMLLMFAVGTGNLVWMLVLAFVMGAEKNLSWGRRLGTPLGITLLAFGVAILVSNL